MRNLAVKELVPPSSERSLQLQNARTKRRLDLSGLRLVTAAFVLPAMFALGWYLKHRKDDPNLKTSIQKISEKGIEVSPLVLNNRLSTLRLRQAALDVEEKETRSRIERLKKLKLEKALMDGQQQQQQQQQQHK